MIKQKFLIGLFALLCVTTSWSANGDVFTSVTSDGIQMTFKVINETDKTCQVGNGTTKCLNGSYTEIIIPEEINGYSVISIGQSAFSNYGYTCRVTIPNTIRTIASNAFWYCPMTSLTIGNGVTKIESRAFAMNNLLKSVYISDLEAWCNIDFPATGGNPLYQTDPSGGVQPKLYYNGELINDLIIPDGVTSISARSFQGCKQLRSVKIPSSINSIGDYAFANIDNLTDVIVERKDPLSISWGTFENYTNITLTVPYNSKANYENADYWKDFKEIVEMAPSEIEITISNAGIGTYCSEYDLDFTNVAGMKAFIASGFNPSDGDVLLTRVYKVPAGEGLLLKGDEGTYEVACKSTDMFYTNLLVGLTTATTISPTNSNYTNFILANGSYGVGFYTLSEEGEIAANKAYLRIPTSVTSNMSRNVLGMRFDDDTTSIIEVSLQNDTDWKVYDLQGRQVGQPSKGLYIRNGKKVYFK